MTKKKYFCLWEKYKALKIVDVTDEYVQNENQLVWLAQEIEHTKYWARKDWSTNYGNISAENEYDYNIFH